MNRICWQDILWSIVAAGEDESAPIEFYLTEEQGKTKLLTIDTIVSDETGVIGIYLTEN